jgi:hypothetical protein
MRERRRVGLVWNLRAAMLSALVVVATFGLVVVVSYSHVASRAAAEPTGSLQRGGNATSLTQSATVDQQALQACMAQRTVNCEATVPGLAQCMAAKRMDCNQSGEQQMLPAQINATSGAPMSETDAINQARQFYPTAAATAPAAAKYMSWSQYTDMEPAEAGAFPGLSPSRMVWVVTIHTSVYEEPLPGRSPTLEPYYTVVLDAISHQTLVECVGCAAAG